MIGTTNPKASTSNEHMRILIPQAGTQAQHCNRVTCRRVLFTPVIRKLSRQALAILTKTADVGFAARYIASVNFMNAGQTCLIVKHVMVEPDFVEEFWERIAYHFANLLEDEGKS
jgi:hypothetical protein